MARNSAAHARAAALCGAASLALAACSTPAPPEPEPITAGTVQQELKVGMGQASVTAALGPPTTVSTDSQQREVWTYDGIASDRVDTTSSIGGGLIVFAAGGGSRASAENARTLTIVVYYDEHQKVREFAYNYSSAR